MIEETLRQQFRNSSDCYADTWVVDEYGEPREGDVIQAITEDGFIKMLTEMGMVNPYDICNCGTEEFAEKSCRYDGMLYCSQCGKAF